MKHLDNFLDTIKTKYCRLSPTNLDKKDSRSYNADFIRFYAIFLVVLLHSVAPIMIAFNKTSISTWLTADILFSFSHQSVPLFVMVSGMLLLSPDKDDRIVLFFKKRLSKILIPFFFWGTIFILWRITYKNEIISFASFIHLFIQGKPYYHFWFMYMIIGLYLATPILRTYLKHADSKNVFFMIALWFFVVSINPLLESFLGTKFGVNFVVANGGYVGYFIMGYILRSFVVKEKYCFILFVIIIIMSMITVTGTWFFTFRSGGEYNGFFVKTSTPNIIFLSLSVFLLINSISFIDFPKKHPLFLKIILLFSKLSFGVFFVHPIIIDILVKKSLGKIILPLLEGTFWAAPLLALFVYFTSCLIVFSMQRIPILKRTVP